MTVLVYGVTVYVPNMFGLPGLHTVLVLPERYKDDAVDDVELLQDTGHTGSRKLGNGKREKIHLISNE